MEENQNKKKKMNVTLKHIAESSFYFNLLKLVFVNWLFFFFTNFIFNKHFLGYLVTNTLSTALSIILYCVNWVCLQITITILMFIKLFSQNFRLEVVFPF